MEAIRKRDRSEEGIAENDTNHHPIPQPPSTTKKPRKSPKRNLPAPLRDLYQQLQSNKTTTAAMQQEQSTAQQLLQEAQRRLEVAHQQLTMLAQDKIDLEEQLLEGELALDNDFTQQYRSLLVFRQDHGHCNVPSSSHPELAAWAKKMRRIRTQWQTGQQYQGPPWMYYLRALDRIGFVWDAVTDKWQSQFEKMIAFKLQNGHCGVPKAYAPDKSLGAWVHRQRYHYKLFHEGKPTQLTPERIELLNSAGFSWNGSIDQYRQLRRQQKQQQHTTTDDTDIDIHTTLVVPLPTRPKRGTRKRTAEEEWEYYYRELCRFRKDYGHVKVNAIGDQNRNNQLRDWVAWQRREYKRWKKGEPSHVTREHVQRLEEVGFQWEIRTSPRDRDSSSTTTAGIASPQHQIIPLHHHDTVNHNTTCTNTNAMPQDHHHHHHQPLDDHPLHHPGDDERMF